MRCCCAAIPRSSHSATTATAQSHTPEPEAGATYERVAAGIAVAAVAGCPRHAKDCKPGCGARMGSTAQASVLISTITMPVLMSYGAHASEDTSMMERLLFDSGAECCVYPRHCAPECPIERVPEGSNPNLVT